MSMPLSSLSPPTFNPSASALLPALPSANGATMTAPLMVLPMRLAARDVIGLLDQGCHVSHAATLLSRCASLGLGCAALGPGDMPHGAPTAVYALHILGQFHRHTFVKIDGHGVMINGRHYIRLGAFGNQVDTFELIRTLREGGLPFGLPYYGGPIMVNSCYSGQLALSLRALNGEHYLCGGKKKVNLSLSSKFDEVVLPALSWQKANGWRASNALWGALYFKTACTVHLAGADTLNLVRHVHWPADVRLADEEQIREAFFQRISVGKPAQVEAFLESWPALAKAEHKNLSPFRFAHVVNRPDIMTQLLKCKDIKWEAELDLLLALAKKDWLVTSRAFDRILGVLESNIQSMVDAGPSDPFWPAMSMAEDFLEDRMKNRVPEDQPGFDSIVTVPPGAFDPFDVSSTASTLSPSEICAALNWHLVDQAARRVSALLNLPPARCEAFAARLRSKVHAGLMMLGAMERFANLSI
jgi:hypothetical protein